LGYFKATNKGKAGRKLALIQKEISAQCSKLNRMDLIPLLLCLEDAMNNFEIVCLKSFRVDKEYQENEDLRLSIIQFINEWYRIINDSIVEISDNGFSAPSNIIRLPEFCFGVCIQQKLEDYLQNLYEQGEIDQTDIIISKPRLFLNRIPGWFLIVLREGVGKHLEDNIKTILNLRDLFYQKGLLETMIYVLPDGAEVEFDDTGMRKITLPKGMTVESMWEQQGITPRLIETQTKVFDWNSYFREIAFESLKSMVRRGKENLANLKKEDEEIYAAYNSIRDYSKTFEDFYGMELKVFFDFCSEIRDLCYGNLHTIGFWNYSDLLKEKRLRSKFNPEVIDQAIKLLSESAKSKNRYDGFIILDSNILTSFRRLANARIVLLEKCFGEVYNNDLKGKAFEEACRKLLREKGLATIPKRIDILEPMLPPEISYFLWGKQKQTSDIDVVSSQDNKILIIECKEIKSIKLKPRQLKQFKKYCVEHFYKTKWILSNLKKFESYVGDGLRNVLRIDETRPSYLFPLVVTNLLVNFKGIKETPLITYLELKDLISKDWRIKKKNETSGSLELEINGRKISLPWLRTPR